MADPRRRLTRFRWWLARRIEPQPDPGEAWCIGCTLNNGRLLILSVDGTEAHLEEHKGQPAPDKVVIVGMWPPRNVAPDG